MIEFQENKEKFLVNENAFSFSLSNGVNCTLVISKSSGKYNNIFKILKKIIDKIRILCSHFEGLFYVIYEIDQRLQKKYGIYFFI